jgi:hypothetical protein
MNVAPEGAAENRGRQPAFARHRSGLGRASATLAEDEQIVIRSTDAAGGAVPL